MTGIPRFARILAIAKRDLALELRGRRGWVLPGVMATLLVPASTFSAGTVAGPPPIVATVSGDVPPEVRSLSDVRWQDRPAAIHFESSPDGPLVVHARAVPGSIRAVLDADRTSVRFEDVRTDFRFPRRSLLLALIAASVLSGAVSESLPGERARRTLESLLVASITRQELVVGKWLAWCGFGVVAALIASAMAIASGNLEPGIWLLPLSSVPACTVALGLFLVRRSADVVGAATVSLRVLPALLACAGIVAWVLGNVHPWLGAALPLGGALLAAGSTWDGAFPAVLAATSAYATTAGLLHATSRGLESDSAPHSGIAPAMRRALIATACASMAWWVPVAGPALWAAGGNRGLAQELSLSSAIVAGGLCCALIAWTAAVHDRARPETTGSLSVGPWWKAAVAGFVLAMIDDVQGHLTLPPGAPLDVAAARLARAVNPTWATPALATVAIVGQELLFRGWLRRTAGARFSAVAYAAVISPLDPAYGLLVASALSTTTTLMHALIARATWLVLAPWLPTVKATYALGFGVLTVIAFNVLNERIAAFRDKKAANQSSPTH